jgi:putative transposase
LNVLTMYGPVSSDITYIPMRRGFLYLVAIMDWFSRYSRYVLGWMRSQTLEKHFCIEALEKALSVGEPEIFNSDQSSQFTVEMSFLYRDIAIKRDIDSMDGRGSGSRIRQYLHRTFMAYCQARRSI